MSTDFEQTGRNQVRRSPARGHYDKDTVYRILDAGYLCHAGFVVENQPFVIPTLYGREKDSLFLHGAPASRMLKRLSEGIPVCLTVTHVDGLVLARSAFHHSMNYRSAMVFGTATEVSDEAKEHGLFVISEQVLKNRWHEARPPSPKELRATSVLRVEIETASAKIRVGPPNDEEADYDLPIWAGVIPIQPTLGPAEADERLAKEIELPGSVVDLLKPNSG